MILRCAQNDKKTMHKKQNVQVSDTTMMPKDKMPVTKTITAQHKLAAISQ